MSEVEDEAALPTLTTMSTFPGPGELVKVGGREVGWMGGREGPGEVVKVVGREEGGLGEREGGWLGGREGSVVAGLTGATNIFFEDSLILSC